MVFSGRVSAPFAASAAAAAAAVVVVVVAVVVVVPGIRSQAQNHIHRMHNTCTCMLRTRIVFFFF